MKIVVVFGMIAALLTGPVLAADELKIPKDGYAVSSDLSLLPDAVQKKRAALLKGAATGDIGKLKSIFDKDKPTVSFGEPEDPIKYLKEQSKDGEGRELLAILMNLLSAPYAAADDGNGGVYYQWPYLSLMDDLTKLTAEQQVDAMRILGYDGMKNEQELGNWLWWRLSIGEKGDLQAFVAGD
jgi:hypothetical protein